MPGHNNSFAIWILSQNQSEIDIIELMPVILKVKIPSTKGFPIMSYDNMATNLSLKAGVCRKHHFQLWGVSFPLHLI